jgi:hypothetical protein
LLQLQVVDLGDCAVDFNFNGASHGADLIEPLLNARNPLDHGGHGVDREPEPFQARKDLTLPSGFKGGDCPSALGAAPYAKNFRRRAAVSLGSTWQTLPLPHSAD